MKDLEDLLRRQLAQTREPHLTAPADLARTLRRRAQRRRTAVPAAAGVVALVGTGATALWLRDGSSRGPQTVIAGSPSPAPPSPRCSVPELISQGGPKSMVEFRWPSGARLLSLQTPAENCPIVLTLSSETLDPADVEAAERRWGANVRLLPYDPKGTLQPAGSDQPTPTPT